MKTICFYLPQYHVIEENCRWWGNDYTDWTSVRNAEQLFEGHFQPVIPLHDNYYDLTQPDVLKWQNMLRKQYRIDGMCFYHYYFDKNTLLLQTPSKILLNNSEIDMPFCFAWDNVSWKRTWSNVPGNSWTDKYEKDYMEIQAGSNGLLMQFHQGDKDTWISHYNYLDPFFRDDRYIKVDGRPVFVVCKIGLLPVFPQMKRVWDDLAIERGEKPVYFMSVNERNENCDAMIFREPHSTRREWFKLEDMPRAAGGPAMVDYRAVWEKLLSREIPSGSKVNLGGFMGYDDTPRRGRNGIVYTGSSPELFEHYLKQLYLKAHHQSDFIFLNAWNEWGEGMYLEPAEHTGYAYLQACLNARNWYEERCNRGEVI